MMRAEPPVSRPPSAIFLAVRGPGAYSGQTKHPTSVSSAAAFAQRSFEYRFVDSRSRSLARRLYPTDPGEGLG